MTRLFGIVGDPIAQVRSPQVFNALFRERAIDAVMVPIHIESNDLGTALAGLRAIRNLDGLVITVPHKPAAAGLLHSCSDRVRTTGATNVLRPSNGGWHGDLFDGEGFAIGLESKGIDLRGKHCSIVGAGGAGAAIALALLDRGVASLSVFDINEGRTADLARRLQVGGRQPVAFARPGPQTDIAINATPLGLNADDPLPMAVEMLRADAIVADAVMKPPITRLLAEAARHGCRIQEGRHMLDSQVGAIWNFFGLS